MNTTTELVFITLTGAGHLPPTLEFAKLLLDRDERLSITFIIMKLDLGPNKKTETQTSTPRLHFIDIPCDESSLGLINPNTMVSNFVKHNKVHVKDIIRGIIDSGKVQLAGIVVDMFCADLNDVANEFGVPSYIYFICSATLLGVMFHLQAKRDQEAYDVTELKDSESKLSIPSYVNPVPAKVLPDILMNKQGGANMYLDLAKRYRAYKGIIVNTFQELESHGLEYLGVDDLPPIFPVGPNLTLKTNGDQTDEKIMTWLNDQPESSVVFVCFGSMGSFSEKQVKEIAVALERSGQHFLWSLRRLVPSMKARNLELPKEYENVDELLPEGFLQRTKSVGKVIGWAPQTAVLSHPSVGGFVSHCGWNSILESIWCGVPIAAWPLFSDQQLNAFQLVVDKGMAVEIRIDYQKSFKTGGGGSNMIVTAEEIESGIRRLMSDDEMRNKVNDMKRKSRLAVLKGGSSDISFGLFIEHLMGTST